MAAIFTITTDHLPLVYIMKTKFLTGRIARQVVELMNFNFTIIHRPGVENTNADALSRLSFMPEEASLVIAMIMGHEVEFTEDYCGCAGAICNGVWSRRSFSMHTGGVFIMHTEFYLSFYLY